ncbi:aminopeptidase [Methanomassiliicoccus luminyensis]|uniref:aminopeptidase n=1 Tax=Methanomassiliicoccus luminyensis TaxID=1080712 RepID=UPI00036136AD|nr:aminopeptidase [Methanomassiliicoccus luminyensis]
MSKLEEAAHVAMQDVLGLRQGEEVLILTNFEGDAFDISKALYDETKKLGGKPVMMVQEPKTILQFAENAVLAAIKANPDIFISVPFYKTGKDPYGQKIGYVGRDGKRYDHIHYKLMTGDRRIRSVWSPSVTRDTFERAVTVDYNKMRANAARLKAAMKGGKEVHVTAPGGTDVTISIGGREPFADDGDFRFPGTGGNLPAGEVYVSPVVASTRGVICYDGTLDLMTRCVQPKTPVRVEFKDGYVSSVTGGEEADWLLEVIGKGEQKAREAGLKVEERNARHLGELGIGLNYNARMINNMLEDEKVGKTCHFAIGMNYDSDAPALIHQDCLVKNPSIWVDGRQILNDGDIIV